MGLRTVFCIVSIQVKPLHSAYSHCNIPGTPDLVQKHKLSCVRTRVCMTECVMNVMNSCAAHVLACVGCVACMHMFVVCIQHEYVVCTDAYACMYVCVSLCVAQESVVWRDTHGLKSGIYYLEVSNFIPIPGRIPEMAHCSTQRLPA